MNRVCTWNFEEGEVYLIDKPLDWTSFDVVNLIRAVIKKYHLIRNNMGALCGHHHQRFRRDAQRWNAPHCQGIRIDFIRHCSGITGGTDILQFI